MIKYKQEKITKKWRQNSFSNNNNNNNNNDVSNNSNNNNNYKPLKVYYKQS